MPCDYKKYSPRWKEIRARILERAGHKCETCGVANYAIGYREKNGAFVQLAEDKHCAGMEVETASMDGEKIIEIVLTVAHLDHDTQNNDPANLRGLCQRCHLRCDHPHHMKNAARTRDAKRMKKQACLFEVMN